ncbi:MAG: c-type cytochrome [Gammaproteobacteria bacterium]|nr:c-type cytochrome [Gammaproteobacteria bacterium]
MKARWLCIPAMAACMVAGQVNAELSKDDAMALAKKSGCLACHSIDKKVVGPAWTDVAAKYKGDASMKEKLVGKIKAGGKGVWGQVPMPPYSPRVADADIEALVGFVLTMSE